MAVTATPLRSSDGGAVVSESGASPMALQVLELAIRALGHRMLTWAVTLGAGVVWAVAVMHPELWRIVAATLYSLTIVWPFLYRDVKAS